MRRLLLADRATESPHLAYQPALDGIRALAVIGVLLYHADIWVVPGGFLGVDVFFALSGYLITTLLLNEHRSSGSIDVRAFWVRRIRRLYPAMLGVLVLVALYAALLADSTTLTRIRGDGLATLTNVANWRFIFSEQSYFEAFAAPSPLRHVWSLAIEEQWYLIWPLAMAGLLRIRSVRPGAWWPVIGLAAVNSALLMAGLFSDGEDPSRVYYGTDTRAQTLLAGAALAMWLDGRTLSRRQQALVVPVGIAGAVACVAAFALAAGSDAWLYRGGFLGVAIAACALVAGAALAPGGFVARALAAGPLPAIGRLSYGLYLWHWPLYVICTEDRLGFGGAGLVAVRLGATAVVSVLSYRLLELPVREGALRHHPWSRVRPAALTASGATAAALLLVLATVGATSAPVTGAVSDVAEGDVRVVVVGDSVGLGLANGLPSDVPGVAVRASAIAGCGLLDAKAVVPADAGDVARTPASKGACEEPRTTEWADALATFDPQVAIIQWGAYEVFDHEVDGTRLVFGTPEFDRLVISQLERHVATLGSTGASVALLTVPCFSNGSAPERNDPSRIDHLNELAAEVAGSTGATLLDLHEQVCPSGEFTPELDGTAMYADGIHFSRAGAAVVWSWLAPEARALAAAAG